MAVIQILSVMEVVLFIIVLIYKKRSGNEAEKYISAAQRNYNSSVTEYSNAKEKFSSNILANMFNHKRKLVFVIPEAERQCVSAKSMFNN